jgi:DNA-binding NarL/FixJ family response regulator
MRAPVERAGGRADVGPAGEGWRARADHRRRYDSLFPALQAGARGYVTKDASAEELEQAIRALVAGRTRLDPAIQRRLVTAVVGDPPPPRRRANHFPTISLRASSRS